MSRSRALLVATLPLLLAAEPERPWLDDIQARVESDLKAESNGRPQLSVSEDDLITIHRKLDGGEIRMSTALEKLRLRIGTSMGLARSAAQRASFEACLAEPRIAYGGKTLSLAEVRHALEEDADAARRGELATAASMELARVLPVSQYAFLAESRELARATGEVTPGFRSRDEAAIPDLADGARAILNETEPAYRWLLAEVARRELSMDASALALGDVPRLFGASMAAELPAPVVDAAISGTFTDLGLDAVAAAVRIERRETTWQDIVVPIDPPHRIVALTGRASGIGALAGGLRVAGEALTYASVRESAPVEARWLSSPSVRPAYGHLLAFVTCEPEWVKDHLGSVDPSRYGKLAALSRIAAARQLAAQVLFEEALQDPRQNAILSYADVHTRALGVRVTPEAAAMFVEDLRLEAPAELRAMELAARAERSLRGQKEAWWKDPVTTKKIREGMQQAGYETRNELVNRFRAQRDDSKSLVDLLLEKATGAGFRP